MEVQSMHEFKVVYLQHIEGKESRKFQTIYARDLDHATFKWTQMILPNQSTLSIYRVKSRDEVYASMGI